MTPDQTSDSINPAQLPAVVLAFLAAHSAHDAEAALRTFTDGAVVVDQDRVFRGTEEVLDFLQNAGSEFTYTSEVVTSGRDDNTHWRAGIRLEGNFPGGVAELSYRFTVFDDRISELTIG